MKTFHVLPKELFLEKHKAFNHSHYIDLPDGTILVCGELKPHRRDEFTGAPSVKSLPHPLSGKSVKPHFDPKHLEHLKTLGAEIADTDTSWDLSEKMRTVHPGLRID
jgi:hypothetical protein